MSRSRPVCSPPSVRSATRSRRSLRSRTWWTSARPSSHGAPTCLIDDSGEAPVPPAWPDRWMYDGAGLGHAGGDRPDAAAGDELDADPRRRVDRAQVGDELGEVLDRVDVVVRRRADVALAGLAATERGDVGGRLAPGQLAALAGLGALGDLDLELVGAGEVGRGHAEPGRGDLLDPGVVALAVRARRVPGRVLAALAGVRRAAGALDADGQRLVRLGLSAPTLIAETTKRRDDRAGVLDLGERDRRRRRAGPAARRAARTVGGGPGEGRAVARERGVDAGAARRRLAGRTGPGSRRRSAARTGGPRRRRGTGRTRGRAGAARGRRRARGWPARRRAGGSGARRGRPGSSGRATPAAVGKQRATTDGVEVDDVDERAADVRGDRADAHPGERLAQAGLERGDEAADGLGRGHRLGAARARRARRRARWRAADGPPSRRRRGPWPSRGRRGCRRR